MPSTLQEWIVAGTYPRNTTNSVHTGEYYTDERFLFRVMHVERSKGEVLLENAATGFKVSRELEQVGNLRKVTPDGK